MELSAHRINNIVRKMFGKNVRLYNDRLKDGTRSIKVEGFQEANYDAVKATLEAEGYTVKKVSRTSMDWTQKRYVDWRLYVLPTLTR